MPLWGASAVVHYNTLADRSPPQVFAVRVIDKHTCTDKFALYYLKVEPRGPWAEQENVAVASSVHDATAPGRRVCVDQCPDALGMLWYGVRFASEAQPVTLPPRRPRKGGVP